MSSLHASTNTFRRTRDCKCARDISKNMTIKSWFLSSLVSVMTRDTTNPVPRARSSAPPVDDADLDENCHRCARRPSSQRSGVCPSLPARGLLIIKHVQRTHVCHLLLTCLSRHQKDPSVVLRPCPRSLCVAIPSREL